VKTATRELALEVPRDRAGTFEPKLVEKGNGGYRASTRR